MTLTKCPRCELNYILDGEQYCKICRMEMKGEPVRDEIEMCTVCGEHPVMPGKDVCVFCYKEMEKREEEPEAQERISVDVGIDPVSTMEEIVPDLGDDIPNREYHEIETDLSLDAMGDEEAEDDGDEDEE